MQSFLIQGGEKLQGEIEVNGSKNAATKLVAATLLTKEECKLSNLPRVKDVEVMLELIADMGGDVRIDGNTARIKNTNIDPGNIPEGKVRKLRSSVVLIGPLLARFGKVKLPYPGGDRIGARSLDTHFNAFSDLGFRVEKNSDFFKIEKHENTEPKERKLTLDEFSVTATENVLMYASTIPAKTEISIAAEEPHVQNLMGFLAKMGADIETPPCHRICIKGASELQGAEQEVVPDYVEAGTFVAATLAVGGDVRIKNFPVDHLELFLHRLKRSGANIEVEDSSTVRVRTSSDLTLGNIQTMIYPGIPTDLQSPIGVLATQVSGTTLIHDPLYEGRLEYLRELKKMGANLKILDPHRAEISGPTKLKGVKIKGKDIRGGMSLMIAGLAAEGTTVIENAYQVDRGYENIDVRLQNLGAKIKRVYNLSNENVFTQKNRNRSRNS